MIIRHFHEVFITLLNEYINDSKNKIILGSNERSVGQIHAFSSFFGAMGPLLVDSEHFLSHSHPKPI